MFRIINRIFRALFGRKQKYPNAHKHVTSEGVEYWVEGSEEYADNLS